jgi:hypothetical protein
MKEIQIKVRPFELLIYMYISLFCLTIIANLADNKHCNSTSELRISKYTGLKYAKKIGCYLGEEINE